MKIDPNDSKILSQQDYIQNSDKDLITFANLETGEYIIRSRIRLSNLVISDFSQVNFKTAGQPPTPRITQVGSKHVSIIWSTDNNDGQNQGVLQQVSIDKFGQEITSKIEFEYHVKLIRLDDESKNWNEVTNQTQLFLDDLLPKSDYRFEIYATYGNKQTKISHLEFSTLPMGPQILPSVVRSTSMLVEWNFDDEGLPTEYEFGFCGNSIKYLVTIDHYLLENLNADSDYCLEILAIIADPKYPIRLKTESNRVVLRTAPQPPIASWSDARVEMDNRVSSVLTFKLLPEIQYGVQNYYFKIDKGVLLDNDKSLDYQEGIQIVPNKVDQNGNEIRSSMIKSNLTGIRTGSTIDKDSDTLQFDHEKNQGELKIVSFDLLTSYVSSLYVNLDWSKPNPLIENPKLYENADIRTDLIKLNLETPRSKRCYECNGGSMWDVTMGSCPKDKLITCYQGSEFACMRFERIENNMHKVIQSCKKMDACEIQKKNFKNQGDCSNGKNCIKVSCCYGDYCNSLESSPTYARTMAELEEKRKKEEAKKKPPSWLKPWQQRLWVQGNYRPWG